MTHSLYSRLKGTLLAVTLLLVCALGVGAYVKNQEGFSGRWNIYLEEILVGLGINAEVGGFRYSLTKGVVTHDFKIFSLDPKTPEKVCATFEEITLDFDGKLVTKGLFDAERLTLKRGKAWIDLNDDEKNRIFIDDIYCVINLTRGYDVIIEECTALVGGMKVTLTGESLGIMQPKEGKSELEVPEVLRGIFRHIYQCSVSEASPPEVDIHLIHKYGNENGLEIDISFTSGALTYRGLEFEQANSIMRYENKTVKVKEFYAQDDTGELRAHGDYYVPTITGTFTLDSTTNLPKIVRSFGIDSFVDKLVSPLPPVVKAKGTIVGKEKPNGDMDWTLKTHGKLNLDEFRLLGTNFISLDTDFSWRDGMLFLRDMDVQHKEGYVAGKILIMDQYIRYEAESNLPIYLYKPFIKEGGILAENINKTDFRENSSIFLTMKGSMQRDQIDQWEAAGSIDLTNVSYNGVPLEDASGSFVFTPVVSEFDDIEATFSYNKYIPSRFAEKQPSRGIVIAEKIRFDSKEETVTISKLGGRAWVAPIMNLFIPEIGEFIDNTVYFTQPPAFSTNGVIGLKGNAAKTNLVNKILLPVNVYYNFLEKDLLFEEYDSVIRLKGHSVYLENIDTYALGGHLKGNIEVLNKNPKAPKGGYLGEVSFTNVSLTDVAETYEFETKTPGILTGRMSFNGLPANVRSLYGEGFISLDQADLFYIPIFGPLSSILSNIMGHKKTSHEKVRNLSANFAIKEGRVLTNDLTTQTPSAKITGDGMIDILTKEMDLTVRTSTQGLLGLITLPIKPLEKLLQFRGTGTMAEPVWEFSPGEATPKYLKEEMEVNRAVIVE